MDVLRWYLYVSDIMPVLEVCFISGLGNFSGIGSTSKTDVNFQNESVTSHKIQPFLIAWLIIYFSVLADRKCAVSKCVLLDLF